MTLTFFEKPEVNYCASCFCDQLFVTDAETGKAMCVECNEFLFPDEDPEDDQDFDDE